jgi:hypothetical protein
MENAKIQNGYMLNHLNNIKRSFMLLLDCKNENTSDLELDIFKSFFRLEIQFRSLNKDIRVNQN